MLFSVLTRYLQNIYRDKISFISLIGKNQKCIFSPKWYTSFVCQHMLLMDMYYLTKRKNIYTNFSNKNRTFQLGEIPYKDYDKAIVNTMTPLYYEGKCGLKFYTNSTI